MKSLQGTGMMFHMIWCLFLDQALAKDDWTARYKLEEQDFSIPNVILLWINL